MFIPNTRFFIAVIAVVLASCGGGESAHRVQVDLLGDSLTSGELVPGALQVRPAQRMTELAAGRFAVVDHSRQATTTAQALAEVPGSGLTFAAYVAQTPAQELVLRFGAADAALGRPPAESAAALREMIRLAHAAGKQVFVPEVIQLRDYAVASDEMNEALIDAARQEGAVVIVLRDIPVVLADMLHPDQDTVDAHWARIAEHVFNQL